MKSQKYLITTSLLNSWSYLFTVDEQYYDKSYNEFVESTLKRTPFEPNQYMLAGIKFEDDAIEGLVPGISEKIVDGCYQFRAMKDKVVGEYTFLLYGRLDVLKAGKIIDIKFKNNISKYNVGEFHSSYQHHMYMEMVPEATEFIYMIGNKNTVAKKNETGLDYTIREERYSRAECVDMSGTISQFMTWLKENDLLEIYQLNWGTF